MLRFVSRFLGVWLLAAALVAAVVDGAKTIAASGLTLTPVSVTWAALPGADAPSGDAAAAPLQWPLDVLTGWLLAVPTVAVLAGLALLFLVAGRKPRRFSLSREFAT